MWWNGRHTGLKIPSPLKGMRVQLPPSTPARTHFDRLSTRYNEVNDESPEKIRVRNLVVDQMLKFPTWQTGQEILKYFTLPGIGMHLENRIIRQSREFPEKHFVIFCFENDRGRFDEMAYKLANTPQLLIPGLTPDVNRGTKPVTQHTTTQAGSVLLHSVPRSRYLQYHNCHLFYIYGDFTITPHFGESLIRHYCRGGLLAVNRLQYRLSVWFDGCCQLDDAPYQTLVTPNYQAGDLVGWTFTSNIRHSGAICEPLRTRLDRIGYVPHRPKEFPMAIRGQQVFSTGYFGVLGAAARSGASVQSVINENYISNRFTMNLGMVRVV